MSGGPPPGEAYMDAAELMARVAEYGADIRGIEDRFTCNAELYRVCFLDFLHEPSFDALSQALDAGDYDRAFEAAHALKGVSGNLGLTPFYESICALVECLRAGLHERAAAEYAKVLRQYVRVNSLMSGGAPPETPEPEPAPARKKHPHDRLVPAAVIFLVISIVGVSLLFYRLSVSYQNNITKESARHLVEINVQLKQYIEQRITSDWRIARSVGDTISDEVYSGGDAAILNSLLQKRAIWHVTDLMLYTENGYCVGTGGGVEQNDVASEIVARARAQGEHMSIVDSEIIYTVPVETELEYRGSRIAAVSTVQRMDTFLDSMGVSSFDGSAQVYLCEADGIVISRLTKDGVSPVFNFTSLISGLEITGLSDHTLTEADLLSVAEPTAFMVDGGGGSEYLVSVPIETLYSPLRLFYLAPERVVNEAMNSFSRRLTILSLTLIIIFSALALLVFVSLLRSRKKRFDRELLTRERMFELLMQNTQTAFGLFQPNGERPVFISGNSRKVTGEEFMVLSRDERGFSLRSGTGGDSGAMALINERLAQWDGTGEFKSGYVLNDRASPPNYYELELYPVDESGEDYVCIAQDVTQAYMRETAAREALDMAEQANDVKSRFLSNMSHDIRTPMNAILNMADFALDSLDDPRALREHLTTIKESSSHLLRLINDVLDMSRIEGGQTVIESEAFDIKRELRRQADMIAPLCAAREQTLITDFARVSTSAVVGDPLKFAQIITNLLSNAVKFTPERGAVRFTAEEIASLRDDMVDLRFTVEDNGIGVPPDFIEHIFDPFARADNRRVSRVEGTGLGLSICHSYVTAMGGSISCESEEGEGSTFTVELFFKKADALPEDRPERAAADGTPFLGMRCLVGEDNPTNQTIARVMLERLGFIVDMAGDGWECSQMFLKSPPGFYDVIYLDIQMPVLDGYQTAVSIRESGHALAGSIPIVAMTANVFAEDIEKARIAGMDGHLGKPILSLDLIEETERAIHKRTQYFQQPDMG